LAAVIATGVTIAIGIGDTIIITIVGGIGPAITATMVDTRIIRATIVALESTSILGSSG
jgi:hypothetical protein